MENRAVIHTFTEFGLDEYQQRVVKARDLMAQSGFSALLITGEANFRYFTGLNIQSWISPTRPMFFLLPISHDPIAVIPSGVEVSMRRTSWVKDIRTWVAPNPADDGVSLLSEAIRETCRSGKIGAEFGPETQLRMPILDFYRLQQMVTPIGFSDGGWICRKLRMVKSPGEIERVSRIADIVSAGFEGLPSTMSIGMTERDACLALQLDVLCRGADKFPYMVAASGPGGYETINTNPSDHPLLSGDVLLIDTGCTLDGYYCDFDRNYAFGTLDEGARRANELVWQATEAGIAAARPGVRLCDVWQAMAKTLGSDAVAGANVGRMGHGVGLQLTEPPSVHPKDETEIEVGMILTVEPGIRYADASGRRRVMVHEENLVVTETGARLLTRRAPQVIPVIS